MGSEERAVREVQATWIEAVNAGDLERLLSLMTDDVLFLTPGQAPVGRDGFPAGFSAAHQRFLVRCVSELDEVVIVGEVAHTVCKDSLSLTPRAGGEVMEMVGHRLTVYRKQGDGRWLLARDAHTLTPAPHPPGLCRRYATDLSPPNRPCTAWTPGRGGAVAPTV